MSGDKVDTAKGPDETAAVRAVKSIADEKPTGWAADLSEIAQEARTEQASVQATKGIGAEVDYRDDELLGATLGEIARESMHDTAAMEAVEAIAENEPIGFVSQLNQIAVESHSRRPAMRAAEALSEGDHLESLVHVGKESRHRDVASQVIDELAAKIGVG